METDKQRIAIAEACGWSQIEDRSERLMMSPGYHVVGYPPVNPIVGKKQELPEYLTDLNAMHEAENVVFNKKDWIRYTDTLLEIQPNDQSPIRATAAQRAEALLKTIGKWEEEATPAKDNS